MMKRYRMTKDIFKRWFDQHGYYPRCVSCGRIIQVNEDVVSTKTTNRSKITKDFKLKTHHRCIPCASAHNLI